MDEEYELIGDMKPLKSIAPPVLSARNGNSNPWIYRKMDALTNWGGEAEPIRFGAIRVLDDLKNGRLKKNDSGNWDLAPYDIHTEMYNPINELWSKRVKKYAVPEQTDYIKITEDTNPEDINDYWHTFAVVKPGMSAKEVQKQVFNAGNGLQTANYVETPIPNFEFPLEKEDFRYGDGYLPESMADIVRARKLDAGLRKTAIDMGFSDRELRKIGIDGVNGLNLRTLDYLVNNIDAIKKANPALSEKLGYLANIFYGGDLNTESHNWTKKNQPQKNGAALGNGYIRVDNNGTPVDNYGNSIVETSTTNSFSNGGRINTSNRFANGGRMSRKESEATRGNARLVRKREEDDDDAYFQDTPRGGSDIDTLAVRVMRGELGTGEQLRRNLGTKYQAVQRRVKQLRASQGGMMGDDVDEFADDELSENAFANGGRLSRITRPNDKRYEIYF